MACDAPYTGLVRALTEYCRPTPQTLQLAERLHTRVDIEWSPIGTLFETTDSEETEESTEQQKANGKSESSTVGVVIAPNPANNGLGNVAPETVR